MLAYCLNVHPGTSLDDVRTAVLTMAPLVHHYYDELTGEPGERGIGIWFSGDAAKEVEPVIADFAAEVAAAGLVCLTFNGFPYGTFHGSRVKESVYLPDWRSKERLDHTLRLARLLTHFLPENGKGAISTVPVGYRSEIDAEGLASATANLAECVIQLQAIYEDTGKRIQLALEPEPDCFLDSVASTLAFFSTSVDGTIAAILQKTMGRPWTDDTLKKHLGLCLDLTHVAVEFETPVETLDALVTAGVPVFKVQVGAALIRTSESNNLSDFADAVYLHQTRIQRQDDRITRFPDLPDALTSAHDGEWRIHYHVPLVWSGSDTMYSSRYLITPEFFTRALQAGINMFEVETYTLGLFPDKSEPDEKILARELAWVNALIPDP